LKYKKSSFTDRIVIENLVDKTAEK